MYRYCKILILGICIWYTIFFLYVFWIGYMRKGLFFFVGYGIMKILGLNFSEVYEGSYDKNMKYGVGIMMYA